MISICQTCNLIGVFGSHTFSLVWLELAWKAAFLDPLIRFSMLAMAIEVKKRKLFTSTAMINPNLFITAIHAHVRSIVLTLMWSEWTTYIPHIRVYFKTSFSSNISNIIQSLMVLRWLPKMKNIVIQGLFISVKNIQTPS